MSHLKVHIRHRFLLFENITCVSGFVSGETFLLVMAPDSAHLAKIRGQNSICLFHPGFTEKDSGDPPAI